MSALQDKPTRRNHSELALAFVKGWDFFDSVERVLRRFAKDGEHAAIREKINGVVFPVSLGDHLTIDIKDQGQFMSVKTDLGRGFVPIADPHNLVHSAFITRLTPIWQRLSATKSYRRQGLWIAFRQSVRACPKIALIQPCHRLDLARNRGCRESECGSGLVFQPPSPHAETV